MAKYRGMFCITLLVLYGAVWFQVFQRPRTPSVLVFLLTPFFLVSVVLSYAAITVIHGVINFNRSDGPLAELKEDLKIAAASLQRAGFDFDKYGVQRP